MRKVILYIAISLDGYIADSSGKVDWLRGQDDDMETDSFPEFEKSIDTVVMGWKTYHQIATELSPDKWVYGNLKSYVCTHRHCVSTESITFSQSDPLFAGEMPEERRRQGYLDMRRSQHSQTADGRESD